MDKLDELARQLLHSNYVVLLIGDEICGLVEENSKSLYHGIYLLIQYGVIDKVITVCDDGVLSSLIRSNDKVVEIYGSTRRLRCSICGRRYYRTEVEKLVCGECGGKLVPEIVGRSQPVPRRVLSQAVYEALTADTLVVLGEVTELPAALLPIAASKSGVNVYIVTKRKSIISMFASHIGIEPSVFVDGVVRLVQAKSLKTEIEEKYG